MTKLQRELHRLAGWDTAEKNLTERVQDATAQARSNEGIQTRSKAAESATMATETNWINRMVVSRMLDSFPETASVAIDEELALAIKAVESGDWQGAYKNIPESSYKDVFQVPDSFDEAWNHPDLWQRDRWRKAIIKEFTKMEERKVWKKVYRSRVPKGKKCVKHKWPSFCHMSF